MVFASAAPQGHETAKLESKSLLLVYLKSRENDDALEIVRKRLPALENAILAGKSHLELLAYLPEGRRAGGFTFESEGGIELFRWHQ